MKFCKNIDWGMGGTLGGADFTGGGGMFPWEQISRGGGGGGHFSRGQISGGADFVGGGALFRGGGGVGVSDFLIPYLDCLALYLQGDNTKNYCYLSLAFISQVW